MNITRRGIIGTLGGTALPGLAVAQASFPSRPVRLVVPFPPAGGADILARLVVGRVAQALGQPIVVDNRPGAGGNIGAGEVARAAPDGYTLLYGHNGTHGINHAIYRNPGFDPIRDFVPVARLSSIPLMLVVNSSQPATNLAEWIAFVRTHPGEVSFASAGNGVSSHLAGVMFRNATGTEMTHVPYRGAAPALTALLAGQVQMFIDLVVTVYPQVQAGRLKAFGVTTSTRMPSAPEVPTLAEAGLPGFELQAWDGIFAPLGTPAERVRTLNAAFNAALEATDVRDTLIQRGAVPQSGSAADFAAHVARELPFWVALAREAGAGAD
ncbi:Bug family tripartite tricarboxylate transporter substrate binding protein [Muricoccus vinaceus]|uniref:Bug family tripartite tricarboxylate transporter substrate binding protein n=1 Tax=Muricoccus vinaceus TaxID=424704 RepID=A0ABV6INK8_9PROT